MLIRELKYDLNIHQRHYYSILVKNIENYSLSKFWKDIRQDIDSEYRGSEYKIEKLKIQHKRVLSNELYPRGELRELVSKSVKGQVKYSYDVFAICINVENNQYFMFSFPFAAFARDIVRLLIQSSEFKKSCELLKVNVSKLVQNHRSRADDKGITRIIGLQSVITGDPSLSSVNINGDDPLHSFLYKEYLLPSIKDNNIRLDQCVLSCELQIPLLSDSQPMINSARIKMHVDTFGNYRFYAHKDGKNIGSLPFFIEKMHYLDCLEKISTNPLLRLHEDEHNYI